MGVGVRSLVIAPQWVGDAVMSEPLLRQLHERGEKLIVIAVPWVTAIYRAMPYVESIIEAPFKHGKLQLRERIKMAMQIKGNFDIAYILMASLKSALLPFFARIPRRAGYLGEMRYGILTDILPNLSKVSRPSMTGSYVALASLTSDIFSERYTNSKKKLFSEHLLKHVAPILSLSPEYVAEVLRHYGLDWGSYYVLAPGSAYGDVKRWPIEHFISLAFRLPRPVVLLGSAQERQLCELVVAKLQQDKVAHACINLAGLASLDQSCALISAAYGVVGNDSGVTHIAAAFAVRQVGIFGPTSPEHTPPLNKRASILWLKYDNNYFPKLDCAPCYAPECPLSHKRCLTDIHPNRVFEALESIA